MTVSGQSSQSMLQKTINVSPRVRAIYYHAVVYYVGDRGPDLPSIVMLTKSISEKWPAHLV